MFAFDQKQALGIGAFELDRSSVKGEKIKPGDVLDGQGASAYVSTQAHPRIRYHQIPTYSRKQRPLNRNAARPGSQGCACQDGEAGS